MKHQFQSLEERLLQTVKKTISTYGMFRDDDIIYLAFSGGKDSLVAGILLEKLGYTVDRFTVDTGDPLFDKKSLTTNARQAVANTEIIRAGAPDSLGYMTREEQREVLWRQKYLRSLPKDSNTSCTHCYYVKMYTLCSVVRNRHGSAVVLGQHRDDMIDSLLKCYWVDLYYREITRPKGLPYDGVLMKQLMNRHTKIDLAGLMELVERHLAGTDEPFVEKSSLPSGIRILRPLGEVSENDIVEYVRLIGCKVSGDFCTFKHNWTPRTRAFRLVVHDDIKRRARANPGLEEELFVLALMSLTDAGTWTFRARNARGKNYPGFKPFIKKL